MKSYETQSIRSIALAGHGGCGKTSLGEAIAYTCGVNTRLGSVSDNTSILDFEGEEQKRGGSISTSLLTVEYDGFKIHVLDTPGDGNFVHEARLALQVVDGAVLVVSAVDGVEVSTEQVSAHAANLGVPRAVFINKMDREHSDYEKVLGEIKEALGVSPVLMQLPLGKDADFHGVVDLIGRRSLTYSGGKGLGQPGEIPGDMADAVAVAIEAMTDVVAEVDDELIEKYLEEGELTQDELRTGLSKAILDGSVVPVLLGSATSNIGVDQLLWLCRAFPNAQQRPAVVGHAPDDENTPVSRMRKSDDPVSALCFKTIIDRVGQISLFRCVSGSGGDLTLLNPRTGNTERLGHIFHLAGKKQLPVDKVVAGDLFAVAKLRDTSTGDTLCDQKAPIVLPWVGTRQAMMSYTIKPKSRSDVDKLKVALSRLLAEDAGLSQSYDEVTKELVLAGMGASHVAVSVDKMERKYGVAVELGTPSIPYRETITRNADVRYRHKKQTGGAGQFGEVAIRVRPGDRGDGFQFVNKIVGGVIPTSLIPSVEKGVRDKLKDGVLAGYPVVDMIVELYDGKYHPVDSKDIAFQIAGRQAIKEAVMKSGPGLLEPIYVIEVVCPEEQVGDVMGDMNTRRGRILNMENRGRNAVVKATVPLAEVQSYAPDLRSMTGGKGSYTLEFNGYENVPGHMLEKLVESLNKARAEAD